MKKKKQFTTREERIAYLVSFTERQRENWINSLSDVEYIEYQDQEIEHWQSVAQELVDGVRQLQLVRKKETIWQYRRICLLEDLLRKKGIKVPESPSLDKEPIKSYELMTDLQIGIEETTDDELFTPITPAKIYEFKPRKQEENTPETP